MSHLLSGVAAAASSMVRRNSPAPFEEAVFRPMNWLYRNLCWYGMQIQRYSNRVVWKSKKILRPAVRYAAYCYKRTKTPIAQTKTTIRSINTDCSQALHRVNNARREGGMLAMAGQMARSLAHGAIKYKSFWISAVNYCLPVLCIALMVLTAFSFFSRSYVLSVECNGVVVGYIEDESTYTEATELVSERVISTSTEFVNALMPTYSLVSVEKGSLNNSTEICNNILLHSDDVDDAYGLFVDDKLIGAVKSEGDLTYILDSFLEQFRIGAANETLSFVGDTDVISGLYATDRIMSSGDLKTAISAKEMQTQVYTIKKNDTLTKILNAYSMSEERFYELNENFSGALQSGSSVLVEKEMPVMRVQSVVVSSYEATIAYSSVTENDATQYTTYKKLKTKGTNGVKLVTKETTYVDGVQTNTRIVNEEILSEPVNEVYVVGTKKTTTTKYNSNSSSFSHSASANSSVSGSGRFTWPVPGVSTISSKYGYRWGRLHAGIDISTSGIYGRTIVAADAGTVTLVRNSPSGYGLHLIINHGNGYTTVYAHCSSILVSAGQTVSKGQAIAKVGNSGRSTGPHLHFEIRVNGTAKNPLNWF